MLDDRLKIKMDERLVRFSELETKLVDPEIGANPNIGDIMREHGTLAKGMASYREYLAALETLEEMRSWSQSDDPDEKAMALEEIPALEERLETLTISIVDLLVGGGKDNDKNVILEIRAGTGGDEAALFAGDLLTMYTIYAETKKWKIETVSTSPGEQGGFKEVVIGIQGKNVFRDLRHEGGGHRVQRVPTTETQGRIHTSAATVAVLAEAEEFEVDIRTEDLKIEVCRSQGPGGQSVNTTDSAVRITHLPTGATVFIQDEKSQHKNKSKAMRILRSRIYEKKKAEEDAARSAERRSQTGSGDRSERIRTYNFPQNRCTDHRLGKNFPLNDIVAGKLDKLIAACLEWGKQQELADA